MGGREQEMHALLMELVKMYREGGGPHHRCLGTFINVLAGGSPPPEIRGGSFI